MNTLYQPSIRTCCFGSPYLKCSVTECRHNLLLDWHGGERPDWLPDCALAVANEGPLSQSEVAGLFGMSRQAVQAIELRALGRVRSRIGSDLLRVKTIAGERATEHE